MIQVRRFLGVSKVLQMEMKHLLFAYCVERWTLDVVQNIPKRMPHHSTVIKKPDQPKQLVKCKATQFEVFVEHEWLRMW